MMLRVKGENLNHLKNPLPSLTLVILFYLGDIQ